MIGKFYLFAKKSRMFYKLQFFLAYLSIRILTFNYFAIRKVLNDFIKTHPYNRLLDFGCGIGILASIFPKKKYVGFDLDSEAISYAKEINPGYNFLVGDATTFKFKEKFDLIIVVGVLHHLNDKEVRSAMKIMSRLLSEKGSIVIIEAIPPIYKWNILGQFLRALDNGHFVRSIDSYRALIGKDLKISKQFAQIGGILDYGVFIINHK